ncbi:acid phosphatase [Duganella sp. Leaf126]|nr:acid phosphatase [Duganella sp. Leaf126]
MLIAALLILWIGNVTDIDLALADAMFDRARNVFPWQHAWLAERFNHELLKTALQLLGVTVVVVTLWDRFRPFRSWTMARRTGMQVLAWSAVLVPAVISLLKRFSTSHCPWDLQRYGGSEPYVRLLEMMPAGIPSGHCMPAGHASSALWLLAVAVFWLPARPRMAAAVGAIMLAFGFAVGWLQQLRGAHFLTHTLWSIWVAVLIVYLLYRILGARNRRAALA